MENKQQVIWLVLLGAIAFVVWKRRQEKQAQEAPPAAAPPLSFLANDTTATPRMGYTAAPASAPEVRTTPRISEQQTKAIKTASDLYNKLPRMFRK